MTTATRTTDYPTGSDNGMSFICNRWVFTGPEGYRVTAQSDGDGFLVIRYNGSSTRPVWVGEGSLNMSEDSAHELAASLAGTTPHPKPTGV